MDLKEFKEKITKQIMADITDQIHRELNISKNGSKKSSVITNPTEIEEDGGNIHHFLHHMQKNVTHAAKKNHIGRKLKNTVNNHVVPVAKDYAKTALKDGAMAYDAARAMARRGFLEKILYGIWNNWPSFRTIGSWSWL